MYGWSWNKADYSADLSVISRLFLLLVQWLWRTRKTAACCLLVLLVRRMTTRAQLHQLHWPLSAENDRSGLNTATCEPAVGDIEPVLKKRRITLKVRPRAVNSDSKTIQDRAEPTKTRIILKAGSCQSRSCQPPTPSETPMSPFRSKWTSAEVEMVSRMEQDKYSWADIHRALPHRSQGSIQVRYSTKLRKSSS